MKELNEFFINQDLIIDNLKKAEEHFTKLTNGKMIVWEDVRKFTESNEFKNVYYFGNDFKRQKECTENTIYIWIDTGYETVDGETIFISLVKEQYWFSGHFVGTGQNLVNSICDYEPYKRKVCQDNYRKFARQYDGIKIKERNIPAEQTDIEVDTTESVVQNLLLKEESMVEDTFNEEELAEKDFCSQKLSDVTEEIFSELLFPNWKSIAGLDWFIKVIGRRINQLIELEQTEYFVMNKIGSLIVNTGLMNVYGTDYLVMYRKYIKTGAYVAYKVITSKSDYIDEGFTVEQSNIYIKPISFFNKESDKCLPSISFNEFDTNIRCMKHIIKERIQRFPEKLQNESTEYIANIVISSLKQGLMIQQRDNTFARAIYTDGKISWLFPLRLGTKVTEEPELVMVIRKTEYFYELKTILPYDDEMRDKITAVSLYRGMW